MAEVQEVVISENVIAEVSEDDSLALMNMEGCMVVLNPEESKKVLSLMASILRARLQGRR